MNHIWVTGCVTDGSYKSHVCQTLLHMGLKWIKGGLYMGVRWVTNGSHITHTLVALSNTTFLIFFSKLTNLWIRHNLATLRIQKINIIFDQSAESNTVVSLTIGFVNSHKMVFWTLGRCDNSLCLASIYWVEEVEDWQHQYEKKVYTSLRKQPKPLAHPVHTVWVSSDVNPRGESLYEYLMERGLLLQNKGKAPTFITRVKQELSDLTICSTLR